MHSPASPDLQRQALLDLAQRAHGGVLFHLILWSLIGWISGLAEHVPGFFWSAEMLFAASLVGRLWLEPKLPDLSTREPTRARALYLALLLANPALWGLTSAVATVWPPIAPAAPWIWFTLTGVAASGGMSLAIDPLVRRAYAPLAVAFPVAAMLWNMGRDQVFPSVAAIVFLLYLHRASKVVHADYWAAARARAELEQRAQLLEHMSCTDALTQVSNRLHFDRQIGTEWARSQRSTTALTVMMVDIDHFKRVNDCHGHPFGDACLQAIAAALRAALTRPGDLLARYGGEEFVAMLPGTDAAGAAAVAARMHAAVASLSLTHDGRAVPLTCSIGVHTVDSLAASSPSAALSRADQALYQAKKQGRDRVMVLGV